MINQVILVGRLTADVELKYTSNNTQVTTFTIACNRRFSNQEQTADFIRCTAWKNSAEYLSKYAKKGDLIGLEGRLQVSSYTDTSGKNVYKTDVICSNVNILNSKQKTSENTATNQMQNNTFEQFGENSNFDISDDDLPF